MKPLTMLVCCALLLAGCAEEDANQIKRAARTREFPVSIPSYDAAVVYAHALPIGGRVDRVTLGFTRYLVVFEHGSGRPVLGIGVYRERFFHWELVAKPAVPTSEQVHASAAGGKIVLTGRLTNQTWAVYDPNQKD